MSGRRVNQLLFAILNCSEASEVLLVPGEKETSTSCSVYS